MGLFTPTPPVDQALAALVIADQPRTRRYAEKALAKSQLGIPSMMEDGEEVKGITQVEFNELLVITSRRLLRVKKGKQAWAPIPLEEVAATSILTRDLGRGAVKYMAVIDTHTSARYSRQDGRHFDPNHHIQIDYDDPQDPQVVCAVIDRLVEQCKH